MVFSPVSRPYIPRLEDHSAVRALTPATVPEALLYTLRISPRAVLIMACGITPFSASSRSSTERPVYRRPLRSSSSAGNTDRTMK